LGDERWRDVLSLLRKGEELAWNQVIDWSFKDVFAGLLHQVRRLNSDHGGPLPETQVIELARELTFEAFRVGMLQIASFDPELGDLPTWLYWKGMAKSKGLLGDRFRQEQERSLQESLDRTVDEHGHARPPVAIEHGTPESILIEEADRTQLRSRINVILALMRPERAAVLVEVWRLREDGARNPVELAASRSGRSVDSMDALLRRARKEFHRLWILQYGDAPFSEQP
jgi:hypothetical protein